MSCRLAIAEEHRGAPNDRESVRLWLRLLSCTRAIEELLHHRLRTHFTGTLPRFDVLAALERNADGMAMRDLSGALLVAKGNVTAIIHSLCRDALVVVTAHPIDERLSVARLTEEGRVQFGEMAAAHHAWLGQFFADLSVDQCDRLGATLGDLKASLDEATRKEQR
jgi:DNA-binding MarR family transcriptional regulator